MKYEETLRKLIVEIDTLVGVPDGTSSAEFKTWKRATHRFLINLFGEGSEEAESFKEANFSWRAMIVSAGTNINREKNKAYVRGLNEVRTTLLSYVTDAVAKDETPTASVIAASREATDAPLILNKKIFVVHGHNTELLAESKLLLKSLDLDPIVLKDRPNCGLNAILEKLEQNSDVGYAIVLLTPDDVGCKKGDEISAKTRARQNVIFELGYFTGKLGRDRVSIINASVEELPSDIVGIAYTERSDAWKYQLANELKAASFEVDLNNI